MEDVNRPNPKFAAAGSEKPGFLARWRSRRAARGETEPESPGKPNASRRFGERLGKLLWRPRSEQAGNPASPVDAAGLLERGIEDKANQTRRFGNRVLRLVDTVRARVAGETSPRVRAQEEIILTDARTDMKDALDDLDVAVDQGGVSGGLGYAENSKSRGEKLNIEPRPAANGLAEFALALTGGGLLLTTWEGYRHHGEHRKIKRERRENFKLFKKQEAAHEQNAEELDKLRREMRERAEMGYVKRVGEFVHTQADVTREVTREVREYKSRVPADAELYLLPVKGAEAKNQELFTSKHEATESQKTKIKQEAGPTFGVSSAPLSHINATMLQKLNLQVKKWKSKTEKVPIKKNNGVYAVVFITFVVTLVIWLLISATK